MLLEKWMPLREFDPMDRRTRRFFEDLGFVPALAPAADAYETDGEYVVEVEVPGFDEKELGIEIGDHTLRITGEREEQISKKEKTVRLRERLERTFERRFDLPVDIDAEHVTAEYTKGVVTVHVPRAAHAASRTIEIAKA